MGKNSSIQKISVSQCFQKLNGLPAGPTRANAEVGSRIKMAKLPIQKSTMAGVMLYYSSLPPLPVQLDLSHLPLAPFSTNFDLGPVTAQVNSQAGDAVSVLPS